MLNPVLDKSLPFVCMRTFYYDFVSVHSGSKQKWAFSGTTFVSFFCSQAVMELLVIYPLAVGGRRLPGLPCPAGAALLLSQQKLMPLTGQRCWPGRNGSRMVKLLRIFSCLSHSSSNEIENHRSYYWALLFCSSSLPIPSIPGFDQHFQVSVHFPPASPFNTISATSKSNFWEPQESNREPLGEKQDCYFCAIQSPHPIMGSRLHSTEVAFALLTQQPWVPISTLPKFFRWSYKHCALKMCPLDCEQGTRSPPQKKKKI